MTEIAGNIGTTNTTTLTNYIVANISAIIPSASFTSSNIIVRIPQVMWVNDTSSNTPTLWNWSFGDDLTWTNGTSNSTTHQYSRTGLFTITLIDSNAAGTSSASSTIWVKNPYYMFNPNAQVYYSCSDMSYSSSRELSDSEVRLVDGKIVKLCGG